jgi:hypothetical protein
MDLVKIFRLLVVFNFLVVMSHLTLVYDTFIVSELDLAAAQEESLKGVMDSWSMALIIIFLLAAFLTGPLLFFFVKWSRELLVGVLAVVLGMQLIDGLNGSYFVASDLEVLAGGLEALTHGAILAIAYLTPLKDKFN